LDKLTAPLSGAKALTGEQTNSSILFPNLVMPDALDGVILKVLRYPAPVPHPDVEVPQALHRVGFTAVPKALGFTTAEIPELGLVTTSITSQLIPDADDGFELACAYTKRNESFITQAERLGENIAELHNALALAFPETAELDLTEFRTALRERAETAIAEIPQLSQYRDAIFNSYNNLATQSELQRIHGDLHLGQILYQPKTDKWYVLDFEGEPLRPAAARAKPDFAERDVAGMMRSFAYAAAVGGTSDPTWANKAAQAFIDGYRRHREIDSIVLNALILDKALYEAVYENRHRQSWLPIPLAAITQMMNSVR